jgi:predicted ATP-dependent serine protease
MDDVVRADIAADLEDSPDYYWTKLSPYPQSLRALGAMGIAAEHVGQATSHGIRDIEPGRAPRWPSTISMVELNCGGFYGLTTVGGYPSLGKSMLAMASAIEAAASLDWNVVFLNCEMAPDELAGRFDSYLDAHPHAEDAVDHLRLVHAPRGLDVPMIIGEVSAVVADDRPVLLVVDSVNTAAELMNRNYLDGLRELSLWAMMARRISRGAASFLLVSELNKGGGAKGEKLSYWSDCFLQMTGDKKKGWVRLTIKKTRSTQGEGLNEPHIRLIHKARFLREDELTGPQRHLEVVGGGAYDDDDELDEF